MDLYVSFGFQTEKDFSHKLQENDFERKIPHIALQENDFFPVWISMRLLVTRLTELQKMPLPDTDMPGIPGMF
jgi:hypothetical protein